MTEERSTVRSRQLGDALRAAMRGAKLNGKATAELLSWSESRVSRLITGKLGATEIEVSALLALYGIVGAERDRLLQLTRDQNAPGWVNEELDRTVIDHLRKSLRTVEFQVAMVPVLLQTEAYARAVIARMANAPTDGTEAFLTNRLSRQTVFSRTKLPQYTFYISEFALHLPVGTQRTMSDQLHHLLRMSVRSHISIHLSAWPEAILFASPAPQPTGPKACSIPDRPRSWNCAMPLARPLPTRPYRQRPPAWPRGGQYRHPGRFPRRNLARRHQRRAHRGRDRSGTSVVAARTRAPGVGPGLAGPAGHAWD